MTTKAITTCQGLAIIHVIRCCVHRAILVVSSMGKLLVQWNGIMRLEAVESVRLFVLSLRQFCNEVAVIVRDHLGTGILLPHLSHRINLHANAMGDQAGSVVRAKGLVQADKHRSRHFVIHHHPSF